MARVAWYQAHQRELYRNGYKAGYLDGYHGLYSSCPHRAAPGYRQGFDAGYRDGTADRRAGTYRLHDRLRTLTDEAPTTA